jgi:hypothetical protein
MNDRTKGFTSGFMNTKMVLITAGLGFMGFNLARRLVKEEAEVTINLSDIRNPFSMNRLICN